MEPKAASPALDSPESLQPLPSGQAEEKMTPERFREQLGWALLQPRLRQGTFEMSRI